MGPGALHQKEGSIHQYLGGGRSSYPPYALGGGDLARGRSYPLAAYGSS